MILSFNKFVNEFKTNENIQTVLSKVEFERSEPVSNPDLDLVHGACGSSRLKEDFEQKVSDELQNQTKKGNVPDIDNIQLKTFVSGDKIVTKVSCDVIQSKDGIAYNHFTTRGCIGDNYIQRHDRDVKYILSNLENKYGGVAKQVGKSFEISFKLNNDTVKYKQSFFVASDDKNIKNKQVNKNVTGTNINNLRDNLDLKTKDILIDIDSVDVDMTNFIISYKTGNTKVHKISLLFDDSGNLDKRLKTIKSKNPTFKEIDKGMSNNLDYILAVIPY